MEVSGQIHGPVALQRPWYPLNMRLGLQQSRSGQFVQQIILLPVPEIEQHYLGHSARILVKITN